ncbi:hypothetical protein BDQ12DRAFT_686922 [Crucibulum laeve]|uniref:Uncharacterized protein n=1 Tax=Crucibulum laeve TaxID=68775 RepID=A0A5C3LTC9_9AGAR|nr:hypothetical protein BDQ12DRAFT_686922 [Crucibulum laeve]
MAYTSAGVAIKEAAVSSNSSSSLLAPQDRGLTKSSVLHHRKSHSCLRLRRSLHRGQRSRDMRGRYGQLCRSGSTRYQLLLLLLRWRSHHHQMRRRQDSHGTNIRAGLGFGFLGAIAGDMALTTAYIDVHQYCPVYIEINK